MKLTEALRIIQQPLEKPGSAPYPFLLVCGFTPLHLETFLAAHLQLRIGRRAAVRTGLYGNAVETLESVKGGEVEAVAAAIEWQDLDPRLGFRSAGGWGPAALADIVSVVRATLERMAAAIEKIAAAEGGTAVVCSLPTMPLPPLFHTSGWQMSEEELALERELADFAARCFRYRGFSLVNRQLLADESPAGERYDFKSDLLTGLPYTVAHADRVAAALARLAVPQAPKKGLITDLDDTLWHGLVGEVGPENVSWDLASHQHLHGLYQKLLASFAEEGVLVGIASKNDPAFVSEALARPDMLLPRDRVFPVEVHWNAKSGSVGRILEAWNIGADSVVFVDDSSMELAEVSAAHPGIECIRFPAGDVAAGYALLRRLRDLFGKPRLAEEDAIRLESIRQGAAFREAAGQGNQAEDFLAHAEAVLTLDFDATAGDPRTLELVNKTNQFNLNGIRHTEMEWSNRLTRPGAVLLAASYRDKFGPLGKIAVIEGREEAGILRVGTWVMSCRAFARRIEHQCLKALFARTGAGKIVFDFAPTAKNGPIREFLASMGGGAPEGAVELTRARFEEMCPPLYHRTEETQTSKETWTQSQPA